MNLSYHNSLFVDSNRVAYINKKFWSDIFLIWNVYILSENFIEYQKDLFNDFYSELIDKLSQEDINLKTFQKFFENKLQELNSKLNVFAEKIKERESVLPIQGCLNIFFKDTYMASMIGDVSLFIFRWGKLNYSLRNDVSSKEKIDIFSDFIEGEVEDQDIIINWWGQIQEAIEKKEMEEVLVSSDTEKEISDSLYEILSGRIDEKNIVFLDSYNVKKEDQHFATNSKDFSQKTQKIKDWIYNFLLKYRYPIIISVLVIFVFFLLIFVVKRITTDTDRVEIYKEWKLIDFTISDLKKEISQFKRMDSKSEEKIKKFNDIKEKISILEEKNKWPHDVKELKDILNREYYKWFNIEIVDSFLDKKVVEFSEKQREWVGEVKSISPVWNKFFVGGNKWAIFGVFNKDIKWNLFEYDIWKDIEACKENLLNNGAYCYSSSKDIFNFTKNWLKQLTTRSGDFPEGIQDIWIYWESNFYVLTKQKDLNEKWVYILRYTNTPGSQNKFSESTNYKLSDSVFEEMGSNFSSGFSSFAVDGTFLLWSKKDRSLYQFWRDPQNYQIKARNINLKGWVDPMKWYSNEVKVVSQQWSKYVYLFDKKNQTFTVYKSAPYKTNTSYTNSYDLIYNFRLNFDVSDKQVKDVYVKSWSTPLLYFVTEDGLHKIKLYEFFETFSEN